MTSPCSGSSCTWSHHLIYSLPAEVIYGQKFWNCKSPYRLQNSILLMIPEPFLFFFLIHDQLDIRQYSMTGHSQPSGASILFPRSFNRWAKICLSTTVFTRQIVNVCAWAQLLSCIWLFVTPWTVPHQAPLSMEFSRQEYWSRLTFPTPGDLPDCISCMDQWILYRCTTWEG